MILNPLVVIPSQVDDNGTPRKQLADIHGAPMVVHSYRRAAEAGIGSIIVDCVDDEVTDAVGEEGAYVYRSDPSQLSKTHNYKTESGADRVAETVNRFDRFHLHDIVNNVHDDLPALDPRYIRALMYPLASLDVHIATLVCPLSEDEEKAITASRGRLPLAITPYYACLLDGHNPNQSLRLTVVPRTAEQIQSEGESEDPLGENEYSPVPGLVHRYPDRGLYPCN